VNDSFITGAHDPSGVAVDGNSVYWTNTFSDTIGRANLDGTDINQRFITGAIQPGGIAVVPEPGNGLLVMAGMLGLAMSRRRTA
jgi:hypothetical protein